MDTSSPLTTENLLATAGVGQGCRPWVPPNRPTAPGLHQMRPQMPQQPASTTGEQGTRLATPYQQQVFPPKCPAPPPPHQAPPPVPARIKKAPLGRLKALGVGPLLGGLGEDREGASPRREDLKSAVGLIQMTASSKRWPILWPLGGDRISPIL